MKMLPFLVLMLFLSTPAAVFAESIDDPAIAAVISYGEARGGAESIGSLVDLNMRGWKPQSTRGIEISGWTSEKTGERSYRVSYGYFEHGRSPVVFAWSLDTSNGRIWPLNAISERLMKMACLL